MTREGHAIPLSNFSNNQISIANAVKPLYDLIKSEILLSKIIKTDDTDCKIQVSKLKYRKIKTPRNIRKAR
ncbi:MAG: transposase [Cyanobacteria bacterium REEB67]|nr:transposase [Cyanobacteria bacterium REEB67]